MMHSALDALIGILNRAFSLPVLQEKELPCGNEEWERILSLSAQQRVLPLVVSMFDVLPPDRTATWTTASEGRLMAEKLIEKQRLRLDLIPRLAGLFKERGLDVMFLKGATLSLRYPSVELRFFGDLDFYLFGHTKDATEVLAENGVESNHKSNYILDDALKSMADHDRRSFSLPGRPMDNAWRMSPTMEAIFLMRHMSGHFAASEMELRQLYDWILLVRDDGGDIDWKEVARLFEASGMMDFARIVVWIIREKLSVELPCPLLPTSGPMAERVWADMFSRRNQDKYRKGSLRYFIREAQVLLQNRWKYRLVYPGESFIGMAFHMLKLKLRLGR